MNLEDSLLSDMLKNKSLEKQETKKKIQPLSTLAGPLPPDPAETKKEAKLSKNNDASPSTPSTP